MKFTLSWLKEHLDTDEPLDKLADKLGFGKELVKSLKLVAGKGGMPMGFRDLPGRPAAKPGDKESSDER